MTIIKTYVDANILIVACRGRLDPGERMIALLDDPADEFLTLERTNSPLCRVKEIPVISLHDPIKQ